MSPAVTVKTPPVIRQLPEAVANQIAAGEVVERPAAVVKELAENALDAGATRILVRLDDGGRRLVEVEDDGCGMRRDDLRLALSRHATSKLQTADDLFRVATLGFRGEALPSIAAVSEFALASRPHAESQGWRLALAGGSETTLALCAMAPGTQVSVRNLFWNVPARLKFLKSEASETGHVTDQVIRLALSHPRVAFRLEVGGRAALDQPVNETLEMRVRALFGGDLAKRLIAVEANADTMQLAGFVAHPQEARATAKRQYVFLNGRYVRDRLLLAAVREGFRGFLEPRLHGAVFLHLDLDPALVDVNVHPTKSEVRFRNEGEVFALVRNALQKALGAHAGGFSLLPSATSPASTSAIVHREVVKSPAPAQPMVVTQERFIPRETPAAPEPARASPPVEIVSADTSPRIAESSPAYDARPVPPPTPSRSEPPLGVRRVLQLNHMYLLIETDRGIRLVDQHALHEKALFLQLDPATSDPSVGGSQQLLVPRTIELAASEIAVLEKLLPELAPHGIDAEVFGPTSLLIRAYPAVLKRTNWAAFFASLAEHGSGAKAIAGLSLRIAHSAACHGAIKAGQDLTSEEQWELVRLLYRLENMEHCPHGRPTTLDLPWGELERRFQR